MTMTLSIGDTAPDFTSETQFGPFDFYRWAGDSWVFFFSHPSDFTPVCTTEMGRTAQLADEFAHRSVKPLGLSTDSAPVHRRWIADVDETQHTRLHYPIVADVDRSVALAYGMIQHRESELAAVRSVFIIDPDRRIRLTMTYPMSVGRNFDEILRAIDALQLTDRLHVVTPADWRPGDPVMIPPTIGDVEAAVQFPQGWSAPRPYLRITQVT